MPYIIAPAGTSPAGTHNPADVLAPGKPPAIFAFKIDPETGDYASVMQGVHPIDAMVLQRIRVRRGSGASVMNYGNEFHKVDKMVDGVQMELEHELKRAMRDLIDARYITDVKVQTDLIGVDGINMFFEYVNTRTDKRERVQL